MAVRKHKWKGLFRKSMGQGSENKRMPEDRNHVKQKGARRGGFLFRMLKNYLTCFSTGVTVVLWARRSVEAVSARVMCVASEASAADVEVMLPRAALRDPRALPLAWAAAGLSSTPCVTVQGLAVTFHDAPLYSPSLLNLN